MDDDDDDDVLARANFSIYLAYLQFLMRYELEILNTVVTGLFELEYRVSARFIEFYENASPNYKTLITGCQAQGGWGWPPLRLPAQ